METRLKAARRALTRLGKRGQTTAIPGEVRQILVAYALEQREGGRSWASIAKSLGVSSSGLMRWSQQEVSACKEVVPVEVRVEDLRGEGAVALVSPAGYRIEGLTVSDALQALRDLG